MALLSFLLLQVGVISMRLKNQQARDSHTKNYALIFPTETPTSSVAAWLKAISLHIPSSLVDGHSNLVFEVVTTSRGPAHRLRVPVGVAEAVRNQLLTHLPGVNAQPVEIQPVTYTYAVEVGLSGSDRLLRIGDPKELSNSLLGAMRSLRDGERLTYQWVVLPSPNRRRPSERPERSFWFNMASPTDKDAIKDQRTKLDERNFEVILRIGAVAPHPMRARQIVGNVKAVLKTVETVNTRWDKRFGSTTKVGDRINRGAGALTYGGTLSLTELLGVLAFPIGGANIPGLAMGATRHLPAAESIPTTGRIVGYSDYPGGERPLAVNYQEAVRHTYVVGRSGNGKSTLLTNMALQDMANGHGVIVMESKGDLFNSVLDSVPASRRGDVVILDVTDRLHPVGFNILQQGSKLSVVEELCGLFDHLYRDNGVWTRKVMYFGLRTLIQDPMSTFLDLAPLLSPTGDQLEWRESRVRGVEDREIRLFWQEFERQSKNDQERYVRPVLDRVWQLTARPEIMNIIGQSQSSFDMHDVIAGNKILLVNLAGLPSETASLVGTLIMNTIWREVRTGSAPRPNFLYLDEFQTFTNLPIDPQEMFAQARSFGLGLVVAHQHLRQLPPDLDAAVMANTATKLIFQLSARDAGQLSREFGRRVDESDFTNLHKYHCIASLTGDDGSTQTVTLSTPPEAKPLSHATAIRAMSRQRYGRPVSEVYDEIEQRYTVETKPTKKPTASTGWGVINDDLGQG